MSEKKITDEEMCEALSELHDLCITGEDSDEVVPPLYDAIHSYISQLKKRVEELEKGDREFRLMRTDGYLTCSVYPSRENAQLRVDLIGDDFRVVETAVRIISKDQQ